MTQVELDDSNWLQGFPLAIIMAGQHCLGLLKTATKYYKYPLPIALYRAENPKSRCVDGTTVYGSTGCVRRVTCVFCKVCHTSSAKWREPKHSLKFRGEHWLCSYAYTAKILKVKESTVLTLNSAWDDNVDSVWVRNMQIKAGLI